MKFQFDKNFFLQDTYFFRFIKFLIKFNGIVVLAKLPHSETEKTGYYHRVVTIDELLSDVSIVYADTNSTTKKSAEACELLTQGKSARIILDLNKLWHKLLSFLCIMRCRKVYFHHVGNISSIFKISMRIPFIKRFVDFHGAAPEEHEMVGRHDRIMLMEKMERFALKYADYYIVVTSAMREHLQSKYPGLARGVFILLPIIQQKRQAVRLHPTPCYDKPTVIYAGNSQSWQQLPQMIAAIEKTVTIYRYKIYCTSPNSFNALLPENIIAHVMAFYVDHDDLIQLYANCQYGFVLRQDSVVNRVACPTKLVEYLAYGIVPIMDSPHVGDFCALGMRYVSLEDFERGMLPDEETRLDIVRDNRAVFERLRQLSLDGCRTLREAIGGRKEVTLAESQ